MTPKPQLNPVLKLALDFGPLLLFFFANARYGIFAATATFMVAVLVALAVSYALTRHFPIMAIVTAFIVIVFGGLTLILHDATFIKVKPTIIYALFGAVLIGAAIGTKSVVKIAWYIAEWPLLVLGLLVTFAAFMYYGPNVKQRFRLLTPGSVFTVGVWLLLGWAFRTYVDHFGKYEATYGAVGGVIILLLFFYLDALVLLIGAEMNSAIWIGRRDFRDWGPASSLSRRTAIPRRTCTTRFTRAAAIRWKAAVVAASKTASARSQRRPLRR